MPYLADLGINCIWLSPLNISHTYHRYDATDLFVVDPDLGTNDDLHELIDQAHERGIRVILDFVPSHISRNHPAFQAAQADADAETAAWFVFTEWPDQYRCFLNMFPLLVSLDTNSAAARQYLIENALYWINEFGMDGFRLDHVIAHGMDFWVEFRQALQAAKPDVVTIGEATDSADALQRYRGRLTHIMDFPLATALRQTFGTGQWSVTQFDHFLRNYDCFMEDGPGRASFLDNHDMNRFRFVAGGSVARLKMAALCQFTLAPTPILYYGTEVGLSQEVDKDAAGFGGDHHIRADMPWDVAEWDQDLLHFYRQLIRLRHEEADLRNGRIQRIHLDQNGQIYAYKCGRLVAAFNLADVEQHLPVGGVGTVVLSTGANPVINAEGIILAGNTAVILRNL